MVKALPPRPNLEFEKKQAKALLKAVQAGDPLALERVQAVHPRLQNGAPKSPLLDQFKLSDAQLVIAREYGLSSWPQLKHQIEMLREGLADTFSEFAAAVRRGNAARVRELLHTSPALSRRINDPVIDFDAPAIVIAASKGRELVDVLLEHGADINARSAWWAGAFGALHGANRDMAAYLIDRGAVVDVHAAAEQGMLDRLRQLLEADPSLVDARGPDGQRPLHFARSVEVIDFLLERGADIDARDVDHSATAAQWMVKDHAALCRHLLKRGAEPDIFMACALGDLDLVKALVDADPAVVDKRIGQEGTPQVPLAPGLHIYFYSFGSNTSPYQIALHTGQSAIYRFLLERSSPQRRFMAACERADAETARRLLKESPDLVASLPKQDQRLLADAAWENRLEAVKVMLEAGFDPHVRGDDDCTPLDRAAFHGFIDVVEVLLRHNPPLTLTNRFGGWPLETALYGAIHSWRRDGDFPATVEALIKAGAEIPPNALPSGSDAVDAVLRRYIPEG
ncbi:MAG: ankyrin repeat domain-containing protein [Chloroflexi bacterium]|nr:ankyrin repeat domain-containing protein [Chloroflexota bacterium]